MKKRTNKEFGLSFVLGAEVMSVIGLHLGYHFLSLGLDSNQSFVKNASTVLFALGIFAAWWLLLSTIIYLVISLVSPATIRSMQGKSLLKSLSLPKARKLVDAALVATIIGSGTVLGPMFAQAATQSTVYVTAENVDPFAPVDDAPDKDKTDDKKSEDSTTTTTIPVEDTAPEIAPSGSLSDIINSSLEKEKSETPESTTTTIDPLIHNEAPPETTPEETPATIPDEVKGNQETKTLPTEDPAAATPSASSYTVVAGDNFWDIAAQHLRSNGGEPTNQEVTNYWVQLVEQNRGNIQSGNPNLIFPGEVINLV